MGLGTKIKNALHGDDRRSPRGSSDYEDGRVPGSFPSESETAAGRTGKHTTVDGAHDPSLTGRTSADGFNTNSTLQKSTHKHRHQKSDSGVDFATDGTGLDRDVRHSKHQPAPGFAGSENTTLEQPQPVKPTTLGTGGKRQDPYWGNINNTNEGTANNAAGVSGLQKDLPLRPEQGATRDVYAKDLTGHNNGGSMLNPTGGHTHGHSSMLDPDGNHHNNSTMLNPRSGPNNGGMLNNQNTLNNLDGERDPYWSNSTGAGLDGKAYGVNNANTLADDGMYNNAAPGTAVSGDYNHGVQGTHGTHGTHGVHGTGLHGNHNNTRGINNQHDVHGSGLTDRNINSTGDRGVGLSGAGMVSPGAPADSLDDGRIRDRDMGRTGPGYGTAAGIGAGVSGIAASEAARRHHDADLKDAGYHSPSSGALAGNNNTVGGANRMNGNSVAGSRAAYARSAGGSPPRAGMQQAQQGQQGMMNSGAAAGLQQQHSSPTSNNWNGPGAHNPARVLHTCTSCGVDNDISQYFRPDVAYRLGQ